LIPSWGARGAAIATLLTYFCLTVFYCFWTQKLHPIEIEYKKIAPSLGMMGGVVLLTNLLAGGDWSLGIFLFKVGMIIVVAWVGFKLKLVESEKPLKLAFSRKG
jgi:O-antigen/teichoic acid export membrane protein